MPELRIRWSEHEARKPYARPFGVSFVDDGGSSLGGIAVSGADLLYYRQFQAAVLALAGEIFAPDDVEQAADPQRCWLDRLAALLPAAGDLTAQPRSDFDEQQGRVFRFAVSREGHAAATVDAPTLLEYQEFQAALAHQSGTLFRDPGVEAIDDPSARRLAWEGALRRILSRPDPSEAIAESWPWR